MAKSNSSKQWLQEHFDDEFVKQSKIDGYRSRAVYKLQELDKKDKLIKPGMLVVDLGSAPGAWTQYVSQKVGVKGEVIALDILDMDPLAGVSFIKGDFTEDVVLQQLMSVVNNREVDLVISDIAPNLSGMGSMDQARSMYLVELAIEFARDVLKPGGDFVAKVFQGEGFDETLNGLRKDYTKAYTRKPKASRPRSREVYYVARNKKSN